MRRKGVQHNFVLAEIRSDSLIEFFAIWTIRNGYMSKPNTTEPLRFDETTLHNYIAKVTETLPGDVRDHVLRAVDEAGAISGTILLLDILRHFRVGDDKSLSEKARQALKAHDKGS